MDIRTITDTFCASPQIEPADIDAIAARGIRHIVNNRPDGEAHDQPTSSEIEAAAREAGIGYTAIPVGHAGFSMPQVDAMADALERADGTVLAFCRSGTRSTLLWAMAAAKRGMEPAAIARAAAAGGYDVGAVAGTIQALAGAASATSPGPDHSR